MTDEHDRKDKPEADAKPEEQKQPVSERDRIYEARRAQQIKEREDAANLPPEQLAQMATLMKQAGAPMDSDDDEQPESDDVPAVAKSEKPEKPAKAAGPTTIESLAQDLASGSETVTIKAYGEEKAVSKAAVLEAASLVLKDKEVSDEKRLEAGLRELSKHEAADVRLRRAKAYEQQLAEWYETVKKETSGSQAATPPATGAQESASAVPTPAPGQLPDGAGEKELKERADEVVSALYAGQRDEAADAFTALLKALRGESVQQKPLDTEAIKRDVLESMQQDKQMDAIKDANTVFEETFPDVYADDVLFAAAQARARQLESDPEWAAKGLAAIAAEAGQYVTNLFSIKPAESSVKGELDERRKLKEVRPKAPTAKGRQLATSLREADKPATKVPSAAEYIRSQQEKRLGRKV